MDFIDEARIFLKAGGGGNGCCSFRREKYVPKGGPDGGDGGKGGDVIIRVDEQIRTLLDLSCHPHTKAKRGQHGQGKNRTGRSSQDRVILVPKGTLVKDRITGELLADMVNQGDSFVAARGGRGGRGNARFASSIMRTPRYCEEGEAGEEREFQLELKLLADVALVGFPNAGKSTIISCISKAKPKIAAYPFTTLSPNLGLVDWKGRDFVIADIPGIVEGAHEGSGLGLRFLRHIERTRIIVYVVDMSPDSMRDPREEFMIIRQELGSYSRGLLDHEQVCVLNKCDLDEARSSAREVAAFIRAKGLDVFEVSAITGEGLDLVLDEIIRLLP
ncbi:MAG: GTPase ObgE [Thermodesulfobacteriota bacterium]|nr:GTPase ObgE [Thermodesulfobacteriota bacterium]